ncbi:hypothetical protein KH400_20075 [Desertibacillus haloalkaliphilus]|nr:hypothetical protein [Desertibacillus haloalkaliphilus]
MVQQQDVVILNIVLTEVRNEYHYSWNFETENWRKYIGRAASERIPSGARH